MMICSQLATKICSILRGHSDALYDPNPNPNYMTTVTNTSKLIYTVCPASGLYISQTTPVIRKGYGKICIR